MNSEQKLERIKYNLFLLVQFSLLLAAMGLMFSEHFILALPLLIIFIVIWFKTYKMRLAIYRYRIESIKKALGKKDGI